MTILVTGATGFIGRALTQQLADQHIATRACIRRHPSQMPQGIEIAHVPDISAQTNWQPLLSNISVVIHTAGHAHILRETLSDPLAEYRRVNVDGTLHLAKEAALVGVKRFIFLSSIGVNGAITQAGHAFSAANNPAPHSAYGLSKMEAEVGLREIASKTGMEVVIIRPPLVYGPGVKANFYHMMKILDKRIPLPLGAIANARSLLALDNLVSLIVTCIEHPHAANQTFLVSDGEDLSTPQLLRRLGHALGKPARLFGVPEFLLRWGAGLLGKREMAQKLCGSLQINMSTTQQCLDWHPPITVDEGLALAAKGYYDETTP